MGSLRTANNNHKRAVAHAVKATRDARAAPVAPAKAKAKKAKAA